MNSVESLVCDLAKNAGSITLEALHSSRDLHVHSKQTEKDIVTDCDRETEQFITSRIRQFYPQHAVFGEEYGKTG